MLGWGKWLDKYFVILLLLFVFTSFSQTLWMEPWQDDNALYFKLAHIEEQAGFLGKGILGEGPYRYTATPYYLLYQLFGFNTAVFFAAAILCYFLASLSIYYLFTVVVNKNVGRLASLLFAANYVASDSFIRLFNSISSSAGVALLSFIIICYWKFGQTKKYLWYWAALIIFLFACELVYVRFHYLAIFIVFLEILLISLSKTLGSLLSVILRLFPFAAIFFWMYISNGDARSELGIQSIELILSGKIENIFSLFTGFGQLIIPDKLLNVSPYLIAWVTSNPYYQVLVLNTLLFILFNAIFFRLSKLEKKKKVVIFFIGLLWLILSRWIFLELPPATPYITLLSGYIGGLALLGFTILGSLLKNSRLKIYFLFLALAVINILFYILYDPTIFYGTHNNRYLVHSYIGVVAMFAIMATQLRSRTLLILVLLWGSLNLSTNILNQHEIIKYRSTPIYSFHQQLKQQVGELPKGSVIYFSIKDNPTVKNRYLDAIISAQMPDTTAIAWRFGLDRYDFKLTNNLDQLTQIVSDDKVPADKIYGFWYDQNGLENITSNLRNFFTGSLKEQVIRSEFPVSIKNISKQEDLVVTINNEISLVTPIELLLTLTASLDLASLEFPFYRQGVSQSVINFPTELRSMALKYGLYKDNLNREAKFTVSDSWQDKIESNLHDSDLHTVWQSNRVLWQKSRSSITIEMKKLTEINRVVWVNGYVDNTPAEYDLQGSLNGQDWFILKKVPNGSERIENGQMQVVEFDPQVVGYIRMVFLKTINNESPAVAEIWPVPAEFAKLDLFNTEDYLRDPSGFIPSLSNLKEELEILDNHGSVQISWLSNASNNWLYSTSSPIKVLYDGQPHQYKVVIPAGGTELQMFKLSNIQVPGDLILVAAEVKRVELE